MKLSKTEQLNLFLVVLTLLVIGFENYNLRQDRNEWIKIANDAVSVMEQQNEATNLMYEKLNNGCSKPIFKSPRVNTVAIIMNP
jgi:hypothetical protein